MHEDFKAPRQGSAIQRGKREIKYSRTDKWNCKESSTTSVK